MNMTILLVAVLVPVGVCALLAASFVYLLHVMKRETNSYLEGIRKSGPRNRLTTHHESVMIRKVPGSERGYFPHVMACHISGPLSLDLLERACRLVCRAHPMFRHHMVPVLDTDRFVFADNDPDALTIPLAEVLSDDDNNWLSVVRTEINGPVLPHDRAPFFRILLCRKSSGAENTVMVVNICHGVEDGTSLQTFVHDLLTFCNQLHEGQQVDVPLNTDLPMAAEPAFHYTMTLTDALAPIKHIINLLRSGFARTLPATAHLAVPFDKRSTELVFHTLPASFTSSLLTCCRREGTTVTGALSAAMMAAVGDLVTGGDPSRRIVINHHVLGNMRLFTKPEATSRTVGLYASNICHFQPYRTVTDPQAKVADMWNSARAVVRTIKTKYQPKSIIPHSLFFDRFCMTKSMLEGNVHRDNGRMDTTQLSNVGVYPGGDGTYGAFKLHKMCRLVGLNSLGALFSLNVSTIGGELNLTMATCTPLATVQQLHEACDSMLQHLHAMIA
eukprot:GILJ01002862.1.p1 GENE.GILJ01002862.1~~GILJ01002862.1.p1  ORF type:complete len:501 (-),score=45.25 GILJ01002862.1:172-1674(-)